MLNSKIIYIVAVILIVVGVTKPNLDSIFIPRETNNSIVIVTPPADQEIRELCKPVIDSIKAGGSSRKKDGQRLSDLYFDLATLIELDGDNEVVKTTEEIRQANSLSGVMLRLNIKGSYPGLSEASQVLLSSQIGDDMVTLDSNLRKKAADTFRALAWACNEGTK